MLTVASQAGSASQKERSRGSWGRQPRWLHCASSRSPDVTHFMKTVQYSQLHLLSGCLLSFVCTSLAVLHSWRPVLAFLVYWPSSFCVGTTLRVLYRLPVALDTQSFLHNRTSNFSRVHCQATKRPHSPVFYAYTRDSYD